MPWRIIYFHPNVSKNIKSITVLVCILLFACCSPFLFNKWMFASVWHASIHSRWLQTTEYDMIQSITIHIFANKLIHIHKHILRIYFYAAWNAHFFVWTVKKKYCVLFIWFMKHIFSMCLFCVNANDAVQRNVKQKR